MRQFLIAIFGLIVVGLYGQPSNQSFNNQVNQHSISAQFAAISYSYAHQFGSKAIFGATFQVGFGYKYYLTGSDFAFSDSALSNTSETLLADRQKFGDYFVDLLKLQLFYRPTLGDHLYFDLGPYVSYGYLDTFKGTNQNFSNGGVSTGLEAGIFYQFWKMHVGTKLTAGFQFVGNSDRTVRYFGVFSTPFLIGINF